MSAAKRKTWNLCPGIRVLDEDHAAAVAGMPVNTSVLDESSLNLDESSFLDETLVRQWRKQGLTDRQIINKKVSMARDVLNAHHRVLDEGMRGANNFSELLEAYATPDEEAEKPSSSSKQTAESCQFAVPALPKHLSRPTPAAGFNSPMPSSSNSGRVGMGSSTPNGANASLRVFRCLDISQVINTETLDSTKKTVQTATVLIPLSEEVDENSSLQKTHTIVNGETSQPLQGTFVVEENSRSLQKTITIDKGQGEDDTDKTLQGTFVVNEGREEHNEDREAEKTLQGTFVVDGNTEEKGNDETIQRTFTVENNSSVLENCSVASEMKDRKKKKKKMTYEEREKKNNTLSSEMMMSSYLGCTPSPGAKVFNARNRKQLRMSVATPPRNKNRLSTESDKEKTIEQLTINESTEIEGSVMSGASYVSPVADNADVLPVRKVTSIREENDEEIQRENTIIVENPEGTNIEKTREMVNGTTLNLFTSIRTPMRTPSRLDSKLPTYAQPTISSINKSKNRPSHSSSSVQINKTVENQVVVEKVGPSEMIETPIVLSINKSINRSRPMDSDRTISRMTPLADRFSMSLDEPELSTQDSSHDVEIQHVADIVEDSGSFNVSETPIARAAIPVFNDSSVQNIENYMNALNVSNTSRDGDAPQSDREDDDDEIPELSDRQLEQEDVSYETPPRQPRRNRRLEESHVESISDNRFSYRSDDDDDDGGQTRRKTRGSRRNKEMVLKKRPIIVPEQNDDGLRRSTRTRVKPLRTWLGEQAVYADSPSGGRRLKGVTEVVIKDKRYCKYRTADPRVATYRELHRKATKKAKAAARRERLAEEHRLGLNLHVTQDTIVTSDEEYDEEEGI